jgi:hypothetical protein
MSIFFCCKSVFITFRFKNKKAGNPVKKNPGNKLSNPTYNINAFTEKRKHLPIKKLCNYQSAMNTCETLASYKHHAIVAPIINDKK